MPALVRRLVLTNFRNYRAATLEAGILPIVLCGPNGAGKTNLIEAISFLTPGRGLRRATLEEIACNEGHGSWAVSAEVEGALGLATLGTGIERQTEDDATVLRKYRVEFDRPVELARSGDDEADTIANTARFTQAIERYVRRYPDQWLWVHRRWKTRPAGEPPLY